MIHAAGKAFAVNAKDIIGGQASCQPAFSPTTWRGLMTALSKDLSRLIKKEDASE